MAKEPISPTTREQPALRAELEQEKEKTKALAAESAALKRQLASAHKSIEGIQKAAAIAAKDAQKRKEELAEAQRRFSLRRPAVGELISMLDALVRERAAIEQGLTGAQAESEHRSAVSADPAEAVEAEPENAPRENDPLRTEDDCLALIAENGRLASVLEAVNADLGKYQEAAEDAQQALERARPEIEKKLRLELERGFETQKSGLIKQIQTLTDQVETQGKTPLLSPEAASGLVDEFVSKLRGGANGLLVRRGELRLKVAFGRAGESTGFVIPTAESSEALRASLHEVVLEFDQLGKEE